MDGTVTQMTTALITGRGASEKNRWLLLGRPLCAYPILAAQSADCINRVVFSTDGRELAVIADGYGADVLQRPAELARADSPHEGCLLHALENMLPRPEILVVLLANVAVHQWGLVDRCVELLQQTPEASAVVPVVARPQFAPSHALRQVGGKPGAGQFAAEPWGDNSGVPYFLTHQMWVMRVSKCFKGGEQPWDFLGPRVLPFIVSHGNDIDNVEDAKAGERWLVNNGWTDKVSMYDTEVKHWRDYV